MSTNSEQYPQEAMLVSLFKTLNDHNIDYSVLHSTDNLPYSIASDLDIAVRYANINKLENLLREAADDVNWFICQKLWYDVSTCIYYVVHSRNTDAWAAIDFMVDDKGIGRYGFPTSELVENRIFHHDFYKTNPTTEFCYKIIKRIRKGELKSGDSVTLYNLLDASNKKSTQMLLKNHLGGFYAKKIIHIFSSTDGTINKGYLRSALLVSNIFHRRLLHPVLFLQRITMQIIRIMSRIYNPTGLLVTIPQSCALDDAEINSLIKSVSPAFRRTKKGLSSHLDLLKSLSTATFSLDINNTSNDYICIKESFLKKPHRLHFNKNDSKHEICKKITNKTLSILETRTK